MLQSSYRIREVMIRDANIITNSSGTITKKPNLSCPTSTELNIGVKQV